VELPGFIYSKLFKNLLPSYVYDLLQLAISKNNKDVAPLCVGKTIEDAGLALENVDKIKCNLEELNTNVDEHNDKVNTIIKQLDGLNNTVKELENLISYINWLQKVEDLRYVL
jgi:archaellum component FlaC